MHIDRTGQNEAGECDGSRFVPPVDTHKIFRRLIVEEVRCGRMTRAHRRRIVQYAAAMGLSPVEAGRLVAACRDELLESADPEDRYHALRLVEPPPSRTPFALRIAGVILAALIIDALLILGWLWAG